MNRFLSTAALSLVLAASVPAAAAYAQVASTFVTIDKPAEGTPILITMPETNMGLLTAAGSVDPKEEWNQNSKKFLAAALDEAIKAKKYTTATVDPAAYEGSRDLQMLKLNDAVTTAIQANTYLKLPTKPTFDWTLGNGASELRPDDGSAPAAYALFIQARGNYSSGGRVALGVIMAAATMGAAGGAQMAGGSQVMTATMVDLNTGKVVWYKTQMYGGTTDLRTEEGAKSAVATLFKTLPL